LVRRPEGMAKPGYTCLELMNGFVRCFCAAEAFEEVIADKRGDKKDWITGAGAGTITGGFYAGLVGKYYSLQC
jgi:hypothetical protein